MSRPSKPALPLTVQPVYLAARTIHNLLRVLLAGTAYFIGIVLLTMFTGQLVHPQGVWPALRCPSWCICVGASTGSSMPWGGVSSLGYILRFL